MARSRRTKRDSATNIYRTCKQSGTCPPDVVNKIENKTVADRILQWGSTGVFLGGLGISTGKGSGGTGGYVPLGEGPGVRVGISGAVRPVVPVDVGPADILPVDAIAPTDPSIIPLTDLTTSTDLSTTGPGAAEIEAVAEIHPVPPAAPDEVPVISGGDPDAAVLEIPPPPKMRRVTSRSHHLNPAFHVLSHVSPAVADPAFAEDIVVLSGSGGSVIGSDAVPEQIPLRDLSRTFQESVVEETDFGGRSSTPVPRRPRPPSRRYYQYTRVSSSILDRPYEAAGFTYANPAFDPDISLDLEAADLGRPSGRSDLFPDLRSLSRPVFTEGADGRVWAGRLGLRGSIQTRSGVTIGPKHYFYHEISSILPELTGSSEGGISDPVYIELNTLGETLDSGGTLVHRGSLESPNEDALLDSDSVDISGQLVLNSGRRNASTLTIPFGSLSGFARTDPFSGIVVDYSSFPGGRPTDTGRGPEPGAPVVPVPPIFAGNAGVDYVLHESLRPRRKRRRSGF
ncbi:L2 protein [Tree shrew papillomavirus 2]|uniref:Minor capsid protein L2 n=1 Tax=Tree shrew papillomavirus 2 TaxID=2562516 RepID=A0AAE6D0B8_9PAPI|nr:L2 protein [Tree shrew papillomavirus 2]